MPRRSYSESGSLFVHSRPWENSGARTRPRYGLSTSNLLQGQRTTTVDPAGRDPG